MSRRIRFLLLSLLLVAVPLQGFAAVSIGICRALDHHGEAGTHAHARAVGDNAAHHAQSASHTHPGDGERTDGKSEPSAHCAACAACGASATIAGYAAMPVLDAPHDVVRLPEAVAPLGITPNGLDRPPLTLLR